MTGRSSLNQSKRGAYTFVYGGEQKPDRGRPRFPIQFPTSARISAAKTFDISNHANFLCDQSEMPPADPLSPRAGSGWNPVGDLASPFRLSRPFERKKRIRESDARAAEIETGITLESPILDIEENQYANQNDRHGKVNAFFELLSTVSLMNKNFRNSTRVTFNLY
jgi:hypothetical protein